MKFIRLISSYQSKTKSVIGSYHTTDSTYFIEKCAAYHVVKKHKNQISSVPSVLVDDQVIIEEDTEFPYEVSNDEGVLDNTTHVTYSLMFYYTPEFKNTTPDVEGFFNLVIANLNAGIV